MEREGWRLGERDVDEGMKGEGRVLENRLKRKFTQRGLKDYGKK